MIIIKVWLYFLDNNTVTYITLHDTHPGLLVFASFWHVSPAYLNIFQILFQWACYFPLRILIQASSKLSTNVANELVALSWCRSNLPTLNCVQDCLQPLSMQALPAQPESLCIVEMGGVEKQDELGEKGTIGFLYLNIGLQVRHSHSM